MLFCIIWPYLVEQIRNQEEKKKLIYLMWNSDQIKTFPFLFFLFVCWCSLYSFLFCLCSLFIHQQKKNEQNNSIIIFKIHMCFVLNIKQQPKKTCIMFQTDKENKTMIRISSGIMSLSINNRTMRQKLFVILKLNSSKHLMSIV